MRTFSKSFIVFILIMIVSVIGIRIYLYTGLNDPNSKGTIVMVTDKSAVTNVSDVSTTIDYIIYTDNGAYLIDDFTFQGPNIYGQLKVGSKYEIFTIPTLDFSYKGTIVRFKEKNE